MTARLQALCRQVLRHTRRGSRPFADRYFGTRELDSSRSKDAGKAAKVAFPDKSILPVKVLRRVRVEISTKNVITRFGPLRTNAPLVAFR